MKQLSLCFTLLICLVNPLYAESLSTTGEVLSNINVFPGNANITKSIERDGATISATYIVVQLATGELLQQTPNGLMLWDGTLEGLVNNELSATGDMIDFNIAMGDFSALQFPFRIFLGTLDDSNTLRFGFFDITALFETISDAQWDETAVRKVLHTFAYGGFAADAQIQTWANMSPAQAIQEILTLDTTNTLVSPPAGDGLDSQDGTLAGLSTFWSSDDAMNPIGMDDRMSFDREERNALARVWNNAVNRRGLNPVRQYIGLWETNYHMVANIDVGVNNYQIGRHYDDIMNALAAGQTYRDVMTTSSLSAAIATQYNHRRNVFQNGIFRGNEDFAREYHQLFFGILGEYNPTYHEEVTIPNTGKALTGMPINFVEGRLDEVVTFNTTDHHVDPLDILNVSVTGQNAQEKFESLATTSISHPESLVNLPIIIARGLADEELSNAETRVLQNSWLAMADKDLLGFLRNYATSTIFHDSNRLKYLPSTHRHLSVINKLTLNNDEANRDLYDVDAYQQEGVTVFRPQYDVFGAQTGLAASDDAEIFRFVYNRSTQGVGRYAATHIEENGQVVWEKDWGSVAPRETDSSYNVQTVAEWLWQRFLSDGLKNFGALERFHVYSLLATGQDPGIQLDANNAERVFTTMEIESEMALTDFHTNNMAATLALADTDDDTRREANRRVGLAINFIVATPFIFAQEGR
ncbi:MAG: DUF1800 family protein [Pseudomonadota bacterium]